MRPLIIFSVVYGKHIDWMNRALVRSLAWPENKAALQHPNTKWFIWGDLETTQSIYEIATKVLPFNQIILKQKRLENNKGGVDLLGMMLETQRHCLLEKVPMFTAPPDTVFSEGSVKAMMDYAEYPGTCVAVPHPRCLPTIMDDLTDRPPTNPQLVNLALKKHVHDAWKTCDVSSLVSGIHVGGIAWNRLNEHTWAVQHRLPTIYIANFTDDDRKFFHKPFKGVAPQYGMWDHEWPGSEVIPKERQRTIGSSDIAFIAECTEYHKNIPTQRLTNPEERDAFHRNELHNHVNRQYVSCFRGE